MQYLTIVVGGEVLLCADGEKLFADEVEAGKTFVYVTQKNPSAPLANIPIPPAPPPPVSGKTPLQVRLEGYLNYKSLSYNVCIIPPAPGNPTGTV